MEEEASQETGLMYILTGRRFMNVWTGPNCKYSGDSAQTPGTCYLAIVDSLLSDSLQNQICAAKISSLLPTPIFVSEFLVNKVCENSFFSFVCKTLLLWGPWLVQSVKGLPDPSLRSWSPGPGILSPIWGSFLSRQSASPSHSASPPLYALILLSNNYMQSFLF